MVENEKLREQMLKRPATTSDAIIKNNISDSLTSAPSLEYHKVSDELCNLVTKFMHSMR